MQLLDQRPKLGRGWRTPRTLAGPKRTGWMFLVAAFVCTSVSPASAQLSLSGFTGNTTQDWFLSVNQRKCVEGGGGPPPCLAHSFTYVTANDLANTAFVGAILFNRYDHSRYDAHWGTDIARHCAPGHQYGNTCVDQDGYFNHAGSANGGPQGTTIRMHPWW